MTDADAPAADPADRPADGAPRPDPGLAPPAGPVTPTPEVDPGDEAARQAAATVQSVSRLEEAN